MTTTLTVFFDETQREMTEAGTYTITVTAREAKGRIELLKTEGE